MRKSRADPSWICEASHAKAALEKPYEADREQQLIYHKSLSHATFEKESGSHLLKQNPRRSRKTAASYPAFPQEFSILSNSNLERKTKEADMPIPQSRVLRVHRFQEKQLKTWSILIHLFGDLMIYRNISLSIIFAFALAHASRKESRKTRQTKCMRSILIHSKAPKKK